MSNARIKRFESAKLPENCPKTSPRAKKERLVWQGRKLPMVLDHGVWRVRSRTKSFPVDFCCDTGSLAEAKLVAKRKLEMGGHEPVKRSTGSVEDLVRGYLEMPKKCAKQTAKQNVSRLRAVVREALGKELEQVRLSAVGPELWRAYCTKKQGGRLDMNTRDPRNISINATLRQARSVVMESLAPEYKRVGIVLPSGASKVRFLPEPTYLAPKEMDDAGFLVEWGKLQETNVPLYRVLGLARFAGMRKSEILAMRGKWLVEARQGWCVEVRDRPEENWYHKTGRRYLAVVLDAGLLAQLRTVGTEDYVVDVVDRINWARDVPQKWMKPFTPARKPLHRLRGVYADQVAELTETAVLARAQGVQAASEALGHTGTAVTQKHYLTEKP